MNTASIQNTNMQDISANLSRLLATGTVKQEQIGILLSQFAAQIMEQAQNLVPVTPAPPYIFEALCNMQKEVSETGIAKTLSATDRDGKELYKARGIDAVYNLLSPLFASHGITLGVDVLETSKQSVQVRTSIQHQVSAKVKYTFISMKDSSSHSVTMIGEAFDYGDKGLAKALSMAFKYACFQVLCIPVSEDPDATVHEKTPANDYHPAQWNQNNAQRSKQSYNRNNNQNNGNSYQRTGNNGQNNGQQNWGNGNNRQNNGNANHVPGNPGQPGNHSQSNGQNNNNGNTNQTITQQQANLLLSKLNAAGADPQKILQNHQIKNLVQLPIKAFEGLIKRLDTHLNELQQMNQQHGDMNGYHQGNYS